jgi:dTDP-4-dehydrorhamnose reductase
MNYSILVTGANGQLGQELQFLAPLHPEFSFIFTDRNTLDISKVEAIELAFRQNNIQACINCAAYTAVDKAESEPKKAELLNDTAVGYLAAACQTYDVPLIHLSSDYVYHNQQNRPLQESDPCQPTGVYASTKLAGEQRALSLHNKTLVIRTSWVYSAFGHNFVKTMLRLGQQRDQLNVVYDQIGAPTYARDIAQCILSIIPQLSSGQWTGVYNFSNAGVTSWYDFAIAIFAIKGIDCQVSPIPSAAYPTAAPRPPYSILDTTKVRNRFKVETPYWRNQLNACLDLL